jgi:aarF domain-containing kinase
MWNELHEWGSDVVRDTINELRGFYIKSGQLIGSRPDLFPEPYTRKLQPLQDAVPPMDGALLVRVVESELLGGRPLSDVFSAFDAAPLGSASVAQVHRAVLRDGGDVVAVKVQRPGMEALMLGDVANVKALALQLEGKFPVSYYTVFSELERQLAFEFDFEHEAASMVRVAATLAARPGGAPLRVPAPRPGLVARRVMVMEFIPGAPLTRMAAEMAAKGIVPGSAAARAGATRLLRALTDAFGAMMLGDGFFQCAHMPRLARLVRCIASHRVLTVCPVCVCVCVRAAVEIRTLATS